VRYDVPSLYSSSTPPAVTLDATAPLSQSLPAADSNKTEFARPNDFPKLSLDDWAQPMNEQLHS
jgi:hypothetical protein